MTAFNESQHDRDSNGRFTEMSGTEQPDVLTIAPEPTMRSSTIGSANLRATPSP